MLHATVALLRFDAKKGEGERELDRRLGRGLDNDLGLGRDGNLGLGLAAAKEDTEGGAAGLTATSGERGLRLLCRSLGSVRWTLPPSPAPPSPTSRTRTP